MQSANGVSINIDKIAALFPNCVTETTDKNGNICKDIDFEKLQEELSDDIMIYHNGNYGTLKHSDLYHSQTERIV